MDKKQIKGFVCDYHKRTRSDVLIDDDINTDEFFSIGDENSIDLMLVVDVDNS
ncbi:pathogenicity island protein, partial [Staphylococcus aureus]|nr:pathogenicity island protein [Staphylococcus aureus]